MNDATKKATEGSESAVERFVILPFFHNAISDEEWENMGEQGKTWLDIRKEFKQPDWCNYPEALNGEMGCWSLIYRMVDTEDYCKGCECRQAI